MFAAVTNDLQVSLITCITVWCVLGDFPGLGEGIPKQLCAICSGVGLMARWSREPGGLSLLSQDGGSSVPQGRCIDSVG